MFAGSWAVVPLPEYPGYPVRLEETRLNFVYYREQSKNKKLSRAVLKRLLDQRPHEASKTPITSALRQIRSGK